MDRLIDLAKSADERAYLELLSRAGTPEVRESLGMTVARATGSWVGDAGVTQARIAAAAQMSPAEREAQASNPKILSIWGQEDGYAISPDMKFT